MKKPLLIAHRGDTTHFPENTLDAFASAFSLGADGVEMDVQLYKNQLIIVHNYLFDESLDYPLLAEVLRHFGDRGRLEIEVKSFSLEILAPLMAALKPYRSLDVEITSSELPLLPHLHRALPHCAIGAIFRDSDFPDWMTEDLILRKITELLPLLGAQVAHVGCLGLPRLTKRVVEALHEAKLKVHSHIPALPLKEQQEMLRIFTERGVDQCSFDDISLAV